MKRNALVSVIILAVLSVAGIFVVQFAFLKNTFEITEKEFRETTTVALREVAWQILEAKGQTSKFDNVDPVKAVSTGYYLVNVNDVIDPDVLRAQLLEQFRGHNMHLDFEYAIYDPVKHEMGFGEYVCANGDSCQEVRLSDFPTSLEFTYYFGVNFPKLMPYLNYRMRDWYLITALLVTVMLFFGYSLYIIVKQRQLSEIQKVFINNLTHELKTPISSISLSAQVISDPEIVNNPKRLFDYVRIINEQSKRLSRNVEKVLSLAALEKNKLHLVKEDIEVDSFMRKSVERFRQSELGQRAEISFSSDRPGHKITADIFHFTNVMQNILENAVKYCRRVPEIEVTAHGKGRWLILTVHDNGIGIPREYRKRIFKKFYRVPTGNIHDVKGFGLGLDYVRRIVKAHRWKIDVRGNEIGGSTFVFHIPLNHE